ncbi:MAG: hydrolase [Clostridia bacterium]|nr:hydrolase [Clostridia bacterium]
MERTQAIALLCAHNREPFHLVHALTLEAVMRYFAERYEVGDTDLWALAGLLHDIDYEEYPEEHCLRAPEMLRPAGATEELIHAVCAHGFGICSEVEPTCFMERILFATDELTGLIGAAVRMRPSGSAADMEPASLRKKFKDKRFAAGCDREVIARGAEMLGWELDRLLGETLDAMKATEETIAREAALLGVGK